MHENKLKKNYFRTAELVLLFVAGPFLFAVCDTDPLLIMPALYVLTLISWLLYRKTPRRSPEEFSLIKLYLFMPGFLVTAAALGLFIILYLMITDSDAILRLPRKYPYIWIAVMILYPVFSALPQEFIYRRFFFARYSDLFSEKDLILFSAVLFGFMHIIFGHWISVVLSTIGGYLFARTYSMSRSLLIASAEHSLYGIVIFTLGFESYFYDGPALP